VKVFTVKETVDATCIQVRKLPKEMEDPNTSVPQDQQYQLKLKQLKKLMLRNVKMINVRHTEASKTRPKEVIHAKHGHLKLLKSMVIPLQSIQKKAWILTSAETQETIKLFGAIPPIQRKDGTGVSQSQQKQQQQPKELVVLNVRMINVRHTEGCKTRQKEVKHAKHGHFKHHKSIVIPLQSIQRRI
jgi:hypothetical protein